MAVTIIDKTKAPSALYVRREHPSSFNTTLDETRYWVGEFTKWIEGIKIGSTNMTGWEYFYLQECKIASKANGRPELMYPMWRDCDHDLFNVFNYCYTHGEDLMIAKKRRAAISTIFGGSIPLLIALTTEGNEIPITSADKERVNVIKSQKFLTAFGSLNDYYKPATYKEGDNMMFSEKVIEGKKTRIEGAQNKVIFKQTTQRPNDVKAFEGVSASYYFIDEIFLHRDPDAVRRSINAGMSSGILKQGCGVLGGSAGEAKPGEANFDYMKNAQKLWLQSASQGVGINTFFISGAVGQFGSCPFTGKPFMINGHSQKDVVIDFIHRRREELIKAGAMQQYRQFVKEYPLTEEEIFSFEGGRIWQPEVAAVLDRQYTISSQPHDMVERGFVDIEGDVPVWRSDPANGNTQILKSAKAIIANKDRQKVKNEFIAGIDPTYGNITDETDDQGQKKSKYAGVIMHRQTRQIVAIFAERNIDVEDVAEKFINTQKYFNNAVALIETQAAAVTFTVYKKLGVYKTLLADKPTEEHKKFITRKNEKGEASSTKAINKNFQFASAYILKYGDTVWFNELIEQLQRWGSTKKDMDIADAFMWCVRLMENISFHESAQTYVPQEFRIRTLQNINGKWQMVLVSKTYDNRRLPQELQSTSQGQPIAL